MLPYFVLSPASSLTCKELEPLAEIRSLGNLGYMGDPTTLDAVALRPDRRQGRSTRCWSVSPRRSKVLSALCTAVVVIARQARSRGSLIAITRRLAPLCLIAMFAMAGLGRAQLTPFEAWQHGHQAPLILDQSMNSGQWEEVRVTQNNCSNVTYTSGMEGFPPASRVMIHHMGSPDAPGLSSTIEVAHRYKAMVYDPATQPMIHGISFYCDKKILLILPDAAAAGNAVNFSFVLFQNNKEYFLHTGTELGFWTHNMSLGDFWEPATTTTLKKENFRTRDTLESPDFSILGAPITFGYCVATSNFWSFAPIETEKTFAIDNFAVRIDQDIDSDEDGLYDDWEKHGIPFEFEGAECRYILPNAKWDRASLWVEVDVMQGCGFDPASLTLVQERFAAAPYAHNVGGSPGIDLTVVVDQTDIDAAYSWNTGSPDSCWPVDFDDWRYRYFGTSSENSVFGSGPLSPWQEAQLAVRAKAFRYCIAAIDCAPEVWGGCGEMPGDNFIVYCGLPGSVDAEGQASAFMHELGHNLGLDHGGGDDINNKPNYPSVMNYSVTSNPGFLDYSRVGEEDGFPILDEDCLDETRGIGTPWGYYKHHSMPFGWLVADTQSPGIAEVSRWLSFVQLNGEATHFGDLLGSGIADDSLDVCAKQDLNYIHAPDDSLSPHEELHPYNDWANIVLPTSRLRGSSAPAPSIPSGEPTLEELRWAAKHLVTPIWIQLPEWKNTDTNYRNWHPLLFAGTATKVHQVFAADLFRARMRSGDTGVRILGISVNPEPVSGAYLDSQHVRIRLGYTNRRPGAPPPPAGSQLPPYILANTGLSIPDTNPPNPIAPMVPFFASDRVTWAPPPPSEWPTTQADMEEWRLNSYPVRFYGAPFEYDPDLGNLLVEIESTTPFGYGVGNGGIQAMYSIYSNGPANMQTSRSYKSSVGVYGSKATPNEALRMRFLLKPAGPQTTADAGESTSVDEGQLVVLDGSGSSGNGPLAYSWVQLPGGTSVVLQGADTATPSFLAPLVAPGGETLAFELTVTSEGVSDSARVNVTIVNVNHTPVADAGSDQSVAEGAAVALNGSSSFDIDGDPITYSWVQVSGMPLVELVGADSATPTFDAPVIPGTGPGGIDATLVFELQVDDGFPPDAPAAGYGFSDVVDRVTVDITNVNNDPLASAGPDQTVDENTAVYLDGTASTDPDGDVLSYAWLQIGGPAVSMVGESTATPSFIAPFVSAGGQDLAFQLAVDDGVGGIALATVVVHVQNANDPPLASAARPSVGVLWPPNHRLVLVSIEGVTDADNNATITITGVTQDEPTSGVGDGDTPVDAIVNPDGTVLLRAERSGTGDGRVYHIHFTASDFEGVVSGVVTVSVPHQRQSTAAVDGGELYVSTH